MTAPPATSPGRYCSACGRPFADPPPVNAPPDDLTVMRAACAALHIATSWDGYVGEVDAARLVRRAPSTLRNRRALDCPIPHRKCAGRVEYALTELVRWSSKNIR